MVNWEKKEEREKKEEKVKYEGYMLEIYFALLSTYQHINRHIQRTTHANKISLSLQTQTYIQT